MTDGDRGNQYSIVIVQHVRTFSCGSSGIVVPATLVRSTRDGLRAWAAVDGWSLSSCYHQLQSSPITDEVAGRFGGKVEARRGWLLPWLVKRVPWMNDSHASTLVTAAPYARNDLQRGRIAPSCIPELPKDFQR